MEFAPCESARLRPLFWHVRPFAHWAAAAAQHFRGRGILWEMYNEPNIRFWRPEPKVKLASEPPPVYLSSPVLIQP